MRTLTFDGRMGASGDMLLGALVAVGADPAVLGPVSRELDVEYDVSRTDRQGIAATDVRVRHTGSGADREGAGGEEADADHAQEPGAPSGHQDHEDAHAHGDGQDHDHAHEAAEGHGPDRTLADVLDVVGAMALPAGVADDARAVFERLAAAEAAVHGTDPAETTFHEVGADDAIADVVGVCLLLDDLDVEQLLVGPVSTGAGEVTFSHGTYPVPTPAVTELLAASGLTAVGGPVDGELLTPTGAALLAELGDGVETLPPMTLDATGYGAGDRDVPGRPNVLRATLGTARGSLAREEISVLETNVDDVTPEVLGDLQESLTDAGALDVSVVPLGMKKSRPGHLVRVVAPPADAERVARRLAAETGTLGVRDAGASHRWVADRETATLTVEIDGAEHRAGVKVARDREGTLLDVSAEYEDARAIARETGRPLKAVVAAVEGRARDRFERRR